MLGTTEQDQEASQAALIAQSEQPTTWWDWFGNSLQTVDNYLGVGPGLLTSGVDTSVHGAVQGVETVAGAVVEPIKATANYLLIGLALVAAIIIIPKLVDAKK